MNTDNEDDQGIVFQKNRGQYCVHSRGREIDCTLSSRLHKQLIDQGIHEIDPIAVGDVVRFLPTGENCGQITGVLPRRSKLSRPATTPGQRVFEQVIVANADQVVPVFAAASPTPKWGLLDRYLVAAGAASLPALICITKTDLGRENSELEATVAEYRRIGYRVQPVSVVTGEGMDEIQDALRDRLSVLVGKSGVGKTSLLNAIQPGLGLRVNGVGWGKQGKGKHTTTGLEMFQLDGGGAVVDTPGIREFGLWDVAGEEVALYFPEMRPLLGRCKFGLDCRHDEEPGCAIRKAVIGGAISPYRYRSYLRLRAEP